MASAEDIARQRALVSAYQAAARAVLGNNSYRMPDGRELPRENLTAIIAGKTRAENQLAAMVGQPKGRMRRGVIVGR